MSNPDETDVFPPHALEPDDFGALLDSDRKLLTRKANPMPPIPRLSDEELRKFVVDWLAGQIVTAEDIKDASLVPMVFLPVAMGAYAYDEDSMGDVGTIYERMTAYTFPRSINGYPIFGSCRLLHRLDWIRIKKAALIEHERQRAIELPADDEPDLHAPTCRTPKPCA